MKKLKQQEKEEQSNPVALKLEFSTLIISSRTFFANIDCSSNLVPKSYLPLSDTGKPVDRALAFFHPPGA